MVGGGAGASSLPCPGPLSPHLCHKVSFTFTGAGERVCGADGWEGGRGGITATLGMGVAGWGGPWEALRTLIVLP